MALAYLKKIDWLLLSPLVFLTLISLTVIFSIAPNFFPQQLLSFIIGWLLVLAMMLVDWRPFFRQRFIIFGLYLTAIIILAATLFLAPAIRHAHSWLVFGSIQFQTSEFAKVALIFLFSYFFARRHIGIARLPNIFIPIFYLAPILLLVLAQPDLGSAIIIIGLFAGYLFVSGLNPRHIIIGLAALIILSVWAWGGFLKSYQKERILGLFYPERDPLGVNYSVIQSKIAIGSAGFWGKGFGQGTQAQLKFLPEAQTDFIFSALIEEWGLLGGLLALTAFLATLLRLGWLGLLVSDNFFKLVCLGAMIIFLLHFALNVGSAVGLTPVVGVPFPFLSYGGSNLLMNFLLIGVIQSLAIRSNF